MRLSVRFLSEAQDPSSPRLHSTPLRPPPPTPLLPFCPRACRIGTDSARLPTRNRCLSVSTPLPPSRPYAAGAQTGYVRSFSMRLRSLGVSASPSEEHRVCLFLFISFRTWFPKTLQPSSATERRYNASQSDGCSPRNSRTRPGAGQNKGLCLWGLFRGPERMRARHRAGGFRVTPSRFVSEVSRTSRSTFLV